MSETAGVPSDPLWVNWQRLSISTSDNLPACTDRFCSHQSRSAAGGVLDSTPQLHHKRPRAGRQSCWTLPEVPILRQFQKLFLWFCLLSFWGVAAADSCAGSLEATQDRSSPKPGKTVHCGKMTHDCHLRQQQQTPGIDEFLLHTGQVSLANSRGCWECFLAQPVHWRNDFDHSSPYRRQGEAHNPGPQALEHIPIEPNTFLLTQSNGGSLRDKLQLIASLGPGLHSFAETHLTGVNFPSFKRTLKQLASQQNRRITAISGFHAPARDTQHQVGSWTGVLQISDFRSYALKLPWPQEHWITGRLQDTATLQVPHGGRKLTL